MPLPILAAGFRLATPAWLAVLAVLPAIVWLRGRRDRRVVLVPYAAAWHRPSGLSSARWPLLLAGAGIVLVILGIARPQATETRRESRTLGYDIMLCLDLSGSMLSEDYQKDGRPMNRLDAVRPVAEAFIEQRPDDRIGVVVFSGHAYTLAPLTSDHAWLDQQLKRVRIGIIEDGTAIGDGLGVALTRLEQAGRADGGKRQGAFIILLTDGANNTGTLAPMQAAAIARARGIPIYTIGAGKDGITEIPLLDDNGDPLMQNGQRVVAREPADLDIEALQDISAETGGHFYRAAETGTIESAFHDIDQAQKIEFQARSTLATTELFPWLLIPGLGLMALGAWKARTPVS